MAVVAILLLAAGTAVGFFVAGERNSALVPTIDVCTIAADGTLTASGKVSGDPSTAHLRVEFRKTPGTQVVDRGRATAVVKDASPAAWKVTGHAGDDVTRVTCVVTQVTR